MTQDIREAYDMGAKNERAAVVVEMRAASKYLRSTNELQAAVTIDIIADRVEDGTLRAAIRVAK